MQYLMDHIVLNVNDEEKMIAFYTEVLLCTPERLEEYRAAEVPFPSVRLNEDTIIDLFPKTLWGNDAANGQGHVNLNHFCIAMGKESWVDLAERLEANAIDIVDGPSSRWGARGVGTSIYFCDPEANLIEARYY